MIFTKYKNELKVLPLFHGINIGNLYVHRVPGGFRYFTDNEAIGGTFINKNKIWQK